MGVAGRHGHGGERPVTPLRRVEAAATERQGRRCLDVHPASSPPAVEDGHESTVYQSPKGLDWVVEGVEGIISASLIEEWLGHGLATVDEIGRAHV